MGGKAFDTHGLSTPRMPPHIYAKVLVEVQTKLRTIYARAETPIEGPGKADYGDVDVIVVAKEGTEPTGDEVAKLLSAEMWFTTSNSLTRHFALPWPEEESADGEVADAKSKSIPGADDASVSVNVPQSQRRFVQVDVNLEPSIGAFNHTLFLHAHGDMGVIIGAVLRRFGFISTTSGFYISIEALESWNKKKARVKLTDDPSTVLRYLGMDEQRFWTKFENWDNALDYISTCRFHDPGYGREYDAMDIKEKFAAKAHDRSKSHVRPMMRYWFEEYLPKHRDDRVGSASHLSREEVVEDAKDFFGKLKAEEFDEQKRTGLMTLGYEKVWANVRKSLPCEGSDLTFAMKGLKLEVVGNAVGKDRNELTQVQQNYADGAFEEVKSWALDNWKKVKERQQQRDRDQSTAKLLSHLEKQKKQQGREHDDSTVEET